MVELMGVASPIPYLVLMCQLGAATALLVAGSIKLAEPSAIRTVIASLGVQRSAEAAFVLAAAELGTGLALILLPGSWVASGLVIALALAFTAAATLALRGRLEIDCACFGSAVTTQLGWRQIILAPAWAAVAISVVAGPVALPDSRLTMAFALIVGIGMTALFGLAPLLIEHRTQCRIVEGY
jgi:hypothetical protein